MKIFLKTKKLKLVMGTECISQINLAENLGIGKSHMSMLLGGTRQPSPQLRKRILTCLIGFGFEDLFEIKE